VQLIPKALVAGLFTPLAQSAADMEKINRVWMQLSRRMGYRQLMQMPDGGATFVGSSTEDVLVIQPPLLQFRSTATMGIMNAADDAQVCLRTVGEHLGVSQFGNLGIKLVYHAPAPEGDSVRYVQHHLLGKSEDDLTMLGRGGSLWTGIKYGISAPEGSGYTLVIEPLIADPKYLFIDLDCQFPGQADIERIADRIGDAERYANDTVAPYLENPPTTA
jgi:hypothetical protein